jgi:hypothetical protein
MPRGFVATAGSDEIAEDAAVELQAAIDALG